MNWDDKLTFEFNGDAPCLASLKIDPVNDVVTVFLAGNSTVVDQDNEPWARDRKSTRLNSSHSQQSRMPSSA